MGYMKHPRTLQEAFGPYTHEYIYDEDDEKGSGWVWAVVSIVATLVLVFIVI